MLGRSSSGSSEKWAEAWLPFPAAGHSSTGAAAAAAISGLWLLLGLVAFFALGKSSQPIRKQRRMHTVHRDGMHGSRNTDSCLRSGFMQAFDRYRYRRLCFFRARTTCSQWDTHDQCARHKQRQRMLLAVLTGCPAASPAIPVTPSPNSIYTPRRNTARLLTHMLFTSSQRTLQTRQRLPSGATSRILASTCISAG